VLEELAALAAALLACLGAAVMGLGAWVIVRGRWPWE
jgi:hypothetical protein